VGVGWRHAGWLGVVALVAAASACSTSSGVQVSAAPASSEEPPTTGDSGAPGEAVPVIGDCHGPVDTKILDAPADARPSVPCSGPHGMETFYVGEIDPSVTTWPGDGNDEAFSMSVNEACRQRHLEYLGLDPSDLPSLPPDRLQVYAFYVPTRADFDGGARWFRCDALVVPVDSDHPTTIDGTLKDVYAQALPAAYRLCGASLGRTAACDEKHQIEYLAAVALGNLVDYPAQRGDLRVTAACRTPLLEALGLTEERADLAFGYLLPSEDEWNSGLHGATCVVGTADSESLNGTLADIGPTKALPLAG
jgi:hypothetical protein